MVLDEYYINIAILTSNNSRAIRNKVGCIIVKNSNIISFSWNGTPSGFDNCCEDSNGNTKQEVIHAEINALSKLCKNGISSDGATMYITLSPCFDCAKAIIMSGIKKVVYIEEYRIAGPLNFLREAGVEVQKWSKQ
jgi:dCMP deaminase